MDITLLTHKMYKTMKKILLSLLTFMLLIPTAHADRTGVGEWEREDETTIRVRDARDVHIEGDLELDGVFTFGGTAAGNIDLDGNSLTNVLSVIFDEAAGCDSTSGSAGHGQVCYDTDGSFYLIDSSGTATPIGAISIGGTATDNAIITADGTGGDLQYRSNAIIDDSGNVSIAADSDTTFTAGRAFMGTNNVSDAANFAHTDWDATNATIALSQFASGITVLNAPAGTAGRLAYSGSTELSWTQVYFGPHVDGGTTLGQSGTAWGDAYLGGVIHTGNSDDTIVIGNNGTITASIADTTVVGANITATGTNTAAVGEGISVGLNAAVVGRNVSAAAGISSALGYSTSVGSNSVAVGPLANAATNTTMAFGRGAATNTTGQIVFGSSGFFYGDVYIGEGVASASPDASASVNATSGTGTNIHAMDLVLRPGASTGNAAPTEFSVEVTDATTSGATVQTYKTAIAARTDEVEIPDGLYLQAADNNAGAPTSGDCDADDERGRISIDTSNNRLYVCNGASRGWDYITLTD